MKDSVIFYKSFYEAIKNIPAEEQLKLYNAIFEYSFTDKTPNLEEGIAKALFILMKPNIDSANNKYKASVENGKKGGRPKKENQDKTKSKPNNNLDKTQEKAKQNLNVDEDVDVNDNVDVDVENKGDGCVDGSFKPDSCVDEVVKFYEQNYGTISPFIYEILEDYRAIFPDDVIIYALKLGVEANAKNIKYVKAILNNWGKANVKTLLDAQNENKKKGENVETNDSWEEWKKRMEEKEGKK